MPIKKETPKDNNSFKNIKVQNIFYMLAYVHREAMPSDYAQMDVEKFHKVNDLFAGILEVGISRQIKQGLHKEYINRSEAMPTLRGKLDIQGSFRLQLQKKKLLACNFDELSENNIYNQILKSTAQMMIRDSTVDDERKSALKKVLLFFQNVDEINLFDVPWNRLQYQRNNRNYNFLMNICNYAVLQYLPIIAKKEKLETNKSIADNTWQRKRIGGLQSTKTKAVNFNGFFLPIMKMDYCMHFTKNLFAPISNITMAIKLLPGLNRCVGKSRIPATLV